MKSDARRHDEEIARAFIAHARRLLATDYLPRIERALATLTPADVWWRANAASNSIGNLLLHLAGNARQWIISGVGGAPDTRTRDSEFAATADDNLSGEELLTHLRATLAQVDEALGRLEPDQLLAQRTIQNCTDVTLLEAVFHVVEHFSMHTGQIILLAKLRTGRDLALYDFSDGRPRNAW